VIFGILFTNCHRKGLASKPDRPAVAASSEVVNAASKTEEHEEHEEHDEKDRRLGPPVNRASSSVELLASGAAPFRKLRYDLTALTPETLRVEVKIRKQADFVHGKFPEASIPGLGVQVSLLPQSRTGHGDLSTTYQVALTAAELLKGPYDTTFRQAFEQGVKSLVGIKGSFVVDDRGLLQDFIMDMPTTLPKLMEPLVHGLRAAISEVVVPLPEEEVGVGGSWSLKTSFAAPYTIEQKKLFHLAGSVATGADVKIEVMQTAVPQPVRESRISKMILESFAGDGAGSAKVLRGRVGSASALDMRSSEVARTPQRSAEYVTTKTELSIVTTVLKP
jgi:hypothetical protein